MSCRVAGALFLVATASIFATGCGVSDSPPAVLTIEGAWARPTPSGATNGVVYLTITADTDDTITSVSVPDDIAVTATLHKTSSSKDEHAHHGDDTNGELVSMSATEAIELEAGKPFVFAPGSNHIMLTNLTEPLTTGTEFTLTFELKSGRTPTIEVTVTDSPPA